MGRKARIQLFCSISSQPLSRETQVTRLGKSQVCLCHHKQVMAMCTACGLIEYNVCSAHDKKPGHNIIAITDQIQSSMYPASIFCFIVDTENMRTLFAKPCPYVLLKRGTVYEGDIILLMKNGRSMHVTRVMEKETSKQVMANLDVSSELDMFYVQVPIALDKAKTGDEVIVKWNTIKHQVQESQVYVASKKLLTEMNSILEQ
jgi:ASC-1-like (ASCH) protein